MSVCSQVYKIVVRTTRELYPTFTATRVGQQILLSTKSSRYCDVSNERFVAIEEHDELRLKSFERVRQLDDGY